MSDAEVVEPDLTPAGWSGPLPAAVRDRTLALASDTLGALPADAVPARLKAVARFAPAKRAKAGGTQLAAALANDPSFRAQVASHVRERLPDLAEALEAGTVPAAGDVDEVAAVAWVLEAPGWAEEVRRAQVRADAQAGAVGGEVERLRAQLASARDQARAEQLEARRQLDLLQERFAAVRREVQQLKAAVQAERERADGAVRAAQDATNDARRQVGTAEAEARRLRARVAEVEESLESGRRAVREGRSADDVRLRLLLDTVLDAAQGLRRELALPPVPEGSRPADQIAQEGARPGGTEVRTRGLENDDPTVLDQLLALPQVHLVVDGYNVTKTGYGELPLDRQRSRLTTRLSALAAQTGAEVTVVFDGATLDSPRNSPPRGVRVLFSPAGTTADTVIRRLVRAEPAGRPVVVVSSDREVADGVRAAGARAVPSTGLLRRLDRS